MAVALPVNAVTAVPRYGEMETRVLQLARAGADDAEIARQLTAEGHRSPSRIEVLCSTVHRGALQHSPRNPSAASPQDAPKTNPLGKNTGPAQRSGSRHRPRRLGQLGEWSHSPRRHPHRP